MATPFVTPPTAHPHITLPQELVDKIIDELGDAYLDHDYFKRSDRRVHAGKALHACALVSKRWIDRSRAHLFKEVKIRAREGNLRIPPRFLFQYVKRLTLWTRFELLQPIHASTLSKTFATSPITHLGITGGVFRDAEFCLQECITTFSATLQTITLKTCTLSVHYILDLVLAHPDLKRLCLRDCCLWQIVSPDHPLITDPGMAPNLELAVFGMSPAEGPEDDVCVLAELQNQFRRLEVDHVQDPDATDATNALIKANSRVLSSLRVHIMSETDPEIQPPFSLEGCFNLSELTLDLRQTNSCILKTSTSILSSLGPTRSIRLEEITLYTSLVYQFFGEEARVDLARDWEDLDTTLSKLATASVNTTGNRLVFSLVPGAAHPEECLAFVREWLPELLPRFRELGSFSVHRGGVCYDDADICCCYSPGGSEKEDSDDGSLD